MLWQAQIKDNSLRRNKDVHGSGWIRCAVRATFTESAIVFFKAGRIISSIHCNEDHNSEATFKTCQGLGY